MIAGEDLGSGSADLLGGFELALGDTPLQLFELQSMTHRTAEENFARRKDLLGKPNILA
jgi:hypothetical protein